MKHHFVILTLCLFLTSCATIFNSPLTNMDIYTTQPSRIILNGDTVLTVNNKASFVIPRSKEPVKLVSLTDSLKREVLVNSRNSFAFKANVYNYGLGLIVDHSHPKRYTYPKVYLNSSDRLHKYSIFGPANNKGEVFLHISLPYINSFQFKPDNETSKSVVGFLGLSIGLDYYHQRNQFLNISASGVIDFLVPFPAPLRREGQYEALSSTYLGFSNNHKISRVTLGYGISYGRNIWQLIGYNYHLEESEISFERDPIDKHNDAMGLILSSYFQTGQNFNIGLIYRPTFLLLNIPDNFRYEHLISIDLAWKIRLKR